LLWRALSAFEAYRFWNFFGSDSRTLRAREMGTRSGLPGSLLGVIKPEKLFDASDLHRVSNPLAYPHEREAASILLMADIGADKGSYSGGVDVGHAGEIQNEPARCIAAYQGLKLKEVRDRDRAVETQQTIIGLRPIDVFNVQRILWHADNITTM
jgi:hypothetical protein